MIKLHIDNQTNYKFEYEKIFKKIVKYVGQQFNVYDDIEIGLIIIDNKAIKKMNRDFRGKDYATDVLSFPIGGLRLGKQIGHYIMGDVFISFEKILEQSKEFGHSEEREWTYLFTHGILHLFGLDHMEQNEEKYMNGLANVVMNKIKVGR